jgi:hypothetical protein
VTRLPSASGWELGYLPHPDGDDLPPVLATQLRSRQSDGWRQSAACAAAGQDWSRWFPPRVDRHGDEAAAVTVRGGCPVQAACLAYALLTGERHGIWGGHTPAQRFALRRLLVEEHQPNSAGRVAS